MLDEQESPAVPSIPVSAPTEPMNTPGARPAAPSTPTLRRPEVLGMQAVAHVLAAWPALPALEFTVHPHGAVVAHIPGSLTPNEAEYTLREWANALIRDPGTMFREADRYDGPWHWIELSAELSTSPAKPGAARVPLTVKGRVWPVPRPLLPVPAGAAR